MIKYITKSPILFLIFNRPENTKLVFEEIRNAKPSKLYIAADGARIDRENEQTLCDKTRSIIEKIDWDCEVKTLFRDVNLGCKYAVSSAIEWFFENEIEGIILEDDCLPNNDFFAFCDEMLDRYRYDTRIRHISGCNFQENIKIGNASYYFSNLTHVWGWASWRRVWIDYNVELSNFNTEEVTKAFKNIFNEHLIAESWINIFNDLKNNKIDTWDYQLTITNYMNNSLSIIPNVNLITNIGFNQNATHTFDPNSNYANVPLIDFNHKIIHPKTFISDKTADNKTLYKDFNIEEKLKIKNKKIKFYKKIKLYLKQKLNLYTN